VDPEPSSVTEADFQALSRFGMASDPPSRIAAEIAAESRRLAAGRLGIEQRYALLLAFVAELGVREGLPRLAEGAERHVTQLREARGRWRTGRWHGRQGG
jgi:hypothetical protein